MTATMTAPTTCPETCHCRRCRSGRTPTTTPTLRTSKGHAVEVRMSDLEAATVLSRVGEAGNRFAMDLAVSFGRYSKWTAGQRPWAHLLANEAEGLRPKRGASAPVKASGLDAIFAMLETAGSTLKYPKATFRFPEGTIRVNVAGARARFPGSINVTDGGGYEAGEWYGRIVDGNWQPKGATPEWVTTRLTEINADPAKAAGEQGHLTGNCCFCSRALTDERSTEVGYGPVCAGHYDLPWG